MGGLCLLFLSAFIAASKSEPTFPAANNSDLQAAMADMRFRSHYSFVILLQMANIYNLLPGTDVTFLMPSDKSLSEMTMPTDRLHEFLLGHLIPSSLLFDDLLHLPTGTLIPSGLNNQMMKISNGGKWSFFVDNAQIVEPNVCLSSLIRCHGINRVIWFDREQSNFPLPTTPWPPIPAPPPPVSSNGYNKTETSPTLNGSDWASPPEVSFTHNRSNGSLISAGTGVGYFFVQIFFCVSLWLLF